ncbi:MAG: T9SS type A sorting domain-containing protein [Ignavibacteriaceae bacterium]|nr:T9SS type A sorting domain-containing protein [Ignavibacteriaceae bacterium]
MKTGIRTLILAFVLTFAAAQSDLLLAQSSANYSVRFSGWRTAFIAGESQNFSVKGVMGEYASGKAESPGYGLLLGSVNGVGIITDLDENLTEMPYTPELSQNYPNPFNPSTTIRFTVAKEADVKLVVYDMLGAEVETLVSEQKLPGTYTVKFDGSRLASGVYIYRLSAGDFVSVKKLMLMK